MLSPLSSSPGLEVLAAQLETMPKHGSDRPTTLWELGLVLYLTAQPDARTTVPAHRYHISMRESRRSLKDIVLNDTVFEWKAVQSPQNTAARPELGYGSNPLLLADNTLTEELRITGSGQVTLHATCDLDALDLDTVNEITVAADLKPLNTEVPVAVEVILTKVDMGSMYAGTLWTYEPEE